MRRKVGLVRHNDTAAERAFIDEVKRAFERPGAGAVTAAAPGLAGRKVVITAGPTHEPIDAEHFIVTHDTGQLGYSNFGGHASEMAYGASCRRRQSRNVVPPGQQ